MGRTNPTYREVLGALEDRWQPYRRALRHEDQARFDRLLTHARTHADAAGNLNHRSPVIPVLLSVAQERRIDELEDRVSELAAQSGLSDGPAGSSGPVRQRSDAAVDPAADPAADPAEEG
jgi:hypothetical protein